MLELDSVVDEAARWEPVTTGRSNASTYGVAPAFRTAAAADRSNQSGDVATEAPAAVSGRSNASTYGVAPASRVVAAEGATEALALSGRSNASTYGVAPASRTSAAAARSNQSGEPEVPMSAAAVGTPIVRAATAMASETLDFMIFSSSVDRLVRSP